MRKISNIFPFNLCLLLYFNEEKIFFMLYYVIILKNYIILFLYFDNSFFIVILINFWNRRNIPNNRIVIVISNFFFMHKSMGWENFSDLYKIFSIKRSGDISVIVFYPISCGINSLILAKYLLCFFSKM